MPRSAPTEVLGTAWRFVMTNGVQTYTFHFLPGGVLRSQGPSGGWSRGKDRWRQEEGVVGMQLSGGIATYEGRVQRGKLRGEASNKSGTTWQFVGTYVGPAQVPGAKAGRVKRAAAKARPSAPSPRGRRPARRR